MDDRSDIVLGDHALDEIFIGGIANEQRHVLGKEMRKARRKIVDDDDAFAGVRQRSNGVAADIASAPGYKYGHISISRRSRHDMRHFQFAGMVPP